MFGLCAVAVALVARQAASPVAEAREPSNASIRSNLARQDQDPQAYVQYLANAGVLVVNGNTKIAFDPIFRSSFGSYLLLSDELERNLFAGTAPFDGLDAVFISHYHGDHFSARDVMRLMAAHADLELFAPAQAVEALHAVARSNKDQDSSAVFERVRTITLDYEQAPVAIETDSLLVEAVRIPHSGWPERMQNVENIAFRVSLTGADDSIVTAAHLGDADTRDEHYDHDADYWAKRPLNLALPPYWYLQSEDGRAILSNRLKPALTMGLHVPVKFSAKDKAAVTSDRVGVMTQPLERRSLQ